MRTVPPPTDSPAPLDVSIIVPVRNAAASIRSCLDSIAAQITSSLQLEIIVVDGMSGDGTREEVQRRMQADSRIRLLDNPAGRVAPALNVGIDAAAGRVLVRMDAHSIYDPSYVQRSLDALQDSGAAAVGGIQTPAPGASTVVARAIAAAQSSRFALGGAAHRREGYQGPAQTLWLGTFPRALAQALGGFDETLFRSEDNDFFQRVRASGGWLLISSEIRARYICRPTLAALARQYWVTGTEILPTMVRNRRALGLRHLVPGLAGLLGGLLVALAVAGPAAGWARPAVAVALLAYLIGLLAAAMSTSRRSGLVTLVPLLAVFPLIHATYALGTLAGLLKALLPRSPHPSAHAS